MGFRERFGANYFAAACGTRSGLAVQLPEIVRTRLDLTQLRARVPRRVGEDLPRLVVVTRAQRLEDLDLRRRRRPG